MTLEKPVFKIEFFFTLKSRAEHTCIQIKITLRLKEGGGGLVLQLVTPESNERGFLH